MKRKGLPRCPKCRAGLGRAMTVIRKAVRRRERREGKTEIRREQS